MKILVRTAKPSLTINQLFSWTEPMQLSAKKLTLGLGLFASLVFISLVSCRTVVPRSEVYGTYVASYPFGKNEITLKPDMTFVQQVTLNNGESAQAIGTWEFDSFDSNATRVTFHGFLDITTPFDDLQENWREPSRGLVDLPVEEMWFRIEMNDADEHPFIHN